MRIENYDNHLYFNCNVKLIAKLDDYCQELSTRMKNDSFLVSEMLKHKTNVFKNCWGDIEHNNPNHPHLGNEITGLYAFAKKTGNDLDWQYIGISRTIKRRFRGHTLKNGKNSSTWAYLIAKHLRMQGSEEEKIIKAQKKYIHSCYFTFVPLKDNMLLHIAEVYCVNKLKSEWNSFKTH